MSIPGEDWRNGAASGTPVASHASGASRPVRRDHLHNEVQSGAIQADQQLALLPCSQDARRVGVRGVAIPHALNRSSPEQLPERQPRQWCCRFIRESLAADPVMYASKTAVGSCLQHDVRQTNCRIPMPCVTSRSKSSRTCRAFIKPPRRMTALANLSTAAQTADS